MATVDGFSLSCPVPIGQYSNILLAHGGGGRLMHQLIETVFRQAFQNAAAERRHDGAILDLTDQRGTPARGLAASSRLAFTTDSYVVRPLFFPGGDIGTLAVNGTVNDLAMCGARPLFLSAAFILEEGLPVAELERIVQSMKTAAKAAHVSLVTGDTKVVDKGKGDGLFVTTAGIGIIEHGLTIAPCAVRPGDIVILNGDVGRHGIAVMAVREGLQFESTIESDCAPLARPVLELLATGIEIHCLRDCTRGGLATTLVEIAESAAVHVQIDDRAIPIHEEVRGACEMLGLDPLYVANEGRFIAFVPERDADRALEVLLGATNDTGGGGVAPAVIGRVIEAKPGGRVTLKSPIGTARILDMLSGEQLPRIC